MHIYLRIFIQINIERINVMRARELVEAGRLVKFYKLLLHETNAKLVRLTVIADHIGY